MAVPRTKCVKGNDIYQKDMIRANLGFIVGCGRSKKVENLLCTYQNAKTFNLVTDSPNVLSIIGSVSSVSYLGDLATLQVTCSVTFNGPTSAFSLSTDELIAAIPSVGGYTGVGYTTDGALNSFQFKVVVSRLTAASSTTLTLSPIDLADMFDGLMSVQFQMIYSTDPLCKINS